MAVKRFKEFGRLTALVAALAVMAAPLSVAAQEEGRGRMREAPARIDRSDGESRPAPQQRSEPRGDAPSWGGGRRAPQAAAPAPDAAPQPARRGGWSRPDANASAGGQVDPESRRGGWSRPDRSAPADPQADTGARRGGWWSGGQSRRTPEADPAPQRRERPATSTESRGAWGGRSGTYTDPNRTGTYSGERRREGDQGGYRDGRRDGRSGEAYRDGRRDERRDERRDDRRNGEASRDGSRGGTWWQGDSSRRSNDDWRRDRRGEYNRHGYRGDHRRWNRDWRSNNRYNWSDYRRQHRSSFSIGFYYSPYRNYSYQRLSIGYYLDSLFFSDRYLINDPWQYRLPDVHGPYRWVRYYDDVLLVDIYSGEVVDVIHNFFY